MRLKNFVLGIGCAAALFAGYGGVVYWQATHLTPQADVRLEKEVLKSANPHQLLVLVAEGWLATGNWPAETGLASGYSPQMFRAQEEVQASRTEHDHAVNCSEEGKPPLVTDSVVKGAYKRMEYYGGSFAGFDETEADFDAFASKISQVTTYYSEDGGQTGVTTSIDGNARWRALLPVIHAPGSPYPILAPVCRRFDEATASKNALIAQIIEAVNQNQTWRWMDATGKTWVWVPTKSSNGEVKRLTLSGSPESLEKLRQELVTEMTRTGVPPWFDMQIARTREDWSPHTRRLTLTTFETRQAHGLAIIVRKSNPNSAVLDVSLRNGLS